MKRPVIVLAAILAGVFIVLSLLDNGRYAMEKQLWRAERLYKRYSLDPKVVPDKSFQSLVDDYRRIIGRYPQAELIPRIYVKIGKIYLLQTQYDRARENFLEAMKRYPDNAELCADALFNTGASYELENKPGEAVQKYQAVVDKYPLTETGLNLPMYIANYHFREKRATETANALIRAVDFYKGISKNHPDTPADLRARTLLASAYFAQAKWTACIQTLGDILFEFADSRLLTGPAVEQIIRSINMVAMTQLQDFAEPIRIYRRFIEENPRHPLSRFLQTTIKTLEGLKVKDGKLEKAQP